MSRMSELAAAVQQAEELGGPLSLSEADLVAMETHYHGLIKDAKRVREHLTHCEFGSQQDLDGFDRILMALGIHDEVTKPESLPTQPKDY